jgi:hypothetical protein
MPSKRLVKAKEYKVKDGDTLASIAGAHGITVAELTRFNWNTDDAGPENMLFRDKLGSRKLDTDKKTYILSKDDDPGVLYIPEKPATPKTFPTNGTHTLTVKVPTKKTFKTARCMVVFRPSDGWKGEYGFDWLRNGDWGNKNDYRPPLLDGGYKAGVKTGMTGAEARTAIKKEFESLPTLLAAKPSYFVAVLNIFPDGLGGTNPPPCTCKLKLSISIEEQAADSLTIRLPVYTDTDGSEKSYFSLTSGSANLPTGVGKHNADIELKCLKEYSSDQEITVVAITRETDGSYKEYVAGKIIALANDASKRKAARMIFIKVTTDVFSKGTPFTGSFTALEKTNMLNALFQPLLQPSFEDGPDLDLSSEDDFLRKNAAGKRGKFYTSKSAAQRGLNQDHKDFYATVKNIFLGKPGNNKYNSDFLVFAFGERPYDKALGQVQDIGVHNLIVFPNRDDCTLNHEALHGFGLQHSFKNDPNDVPSDAKFTFQQGKTDNIMDYTYDSSALIVWHWQWKIVNS